MTHDPTSAPAGRKPKGTSPERRQEILAHALALFCEYGVHRVSTRQIARAVGISQPSLYAHFPNRQAIVNEVCEGAFARLTKRMQAVLRPAHGPEVIQDLARVYIEFGLAEPDAYRVAFMIEPIDDIDNPEPDPGLVAGLKSYAVWRSALVQACGAGVAEQDIDILAQSLWASLHGLVSLLIARPAFPWAERTRLIASHVERLAFAAVRP